ncbi:MAG: indolepyruvate ferredoxin oxidoreductase subunit alpha [Ruminococcus sp.]|jgi:indolepyruvate ferredoxin oxidoreductase alpha subunit|nr:indolepyruvate ferredoxin oxidoreductase subunit alpha [Ruminococcus sp.]
MIMKMNLLGNGAIAMGAIAAGVKFAAGYPGTPSTEILETLKSSEYSKNIHIEWSANEKAAVEAGAGAAYSGMRTLVTMKQVGLNVASDPVMCLAYIGIKGGMVIAVADDPGPISSQTEQDTRSFGAYAHLTVLDPSSPEEAYKMTKYAFELSEKIGRPVILRPTTKVCHASATVDVSDEIHDYTPEGFVKDPKWVIFPPLSYKRHIENFKMYNSIASEKCKYNNVETVPDTDKGIVTGGVTTAIVTDVLESLGVKVNRLTIGRPYPFPVSETEIFAETAKDILVLEELEPFIEENLQRLIKTPLKGKYSEHVPAAGELKYENIESIICGFLGLQTPETPSAKLNVTLPTRAPVLCAGCPHRASFYAVKLASKGKKAVYCGDIGCYTLGNAKPLETTDTCLCMGGGITVAQGIKTSNPDTDVFAFTGDSTFFASGMTGVANAVYNKHNITICILDNRTTAMTGGQPHPGTGVTITGEETVHIDIAKVLTALDVGFVKECNPFDLENAVKTVTEAALYNGVSAIVFKAPCIAVSKKPCTYEVSDCIGCKRCINELGCPAISLSSGKAVIDPVMCYGCGICETVCKPGKIHKIGGVRS